MAVRSRILSPWIEVASANVRTFSPEAAIEHAMTGQAYFRGIDGSATAKAVLEPLAKTPIPAEVQRQAAHYAPQLVATMRADTSRMSRHMTAGSLDTSKLVRLARPSSPAQFERDAATAFRARTMRPVEAPLKIAVVADMCWRLRQGNPGYMPMVGTLAFILSDAAACAGLQAGAYGVRGHYHGYNHEKGRPNEKKPMALVSVICPYGRRIVPKDYAAHTHHTGYIWTAGVALNSTVGHSLDGTGGIDLARERDGATFVVAIGEFQDKAKADVRLDPWDDIDHAVRTVHAALQARQAKRAA